MSNIVPFRRLSRLDTFVNLTTGYGTARDHGQQFSWQVQGPRFSRQALEDIHARHELAWKIVDLLPDNALRNGIHFPKLDEAQTAKVTDLMKTTKIRPALSEAAKLNRLYGALLYLPILDGGDDADEVNPDRIRSIGEVQVIERDYIYPKDLKRSLRYTHYCLNGFDDEGITAPTIHISRIIRIPGTVVTRDWLLGNQGWPPSVLERCMEPLIAYSAAQGLIPNILKDVIRDIVKLAGLNDLALNDCAEDQTAFNDRLDAMMIAQSLINKLVLDTGDDYIRQTTSLKGIPEVTGLVSQRLTAASGLPHTVLLGESPGAALSQSGSSQDRDLNKATEAYQEDVIRPVYEQFFTLAEPLLGFPVEFAFCPLDVPTLKERAEVLKLVSEAVTKLTDAQIITPHEGASPFTGTETGTDIVLDLDARAHLAALNKDLLTHGMEVPAPEAPPVPTEPMEDPHAESPEPEEIDPEGDQGDDAGSAPDAPAAGSKRRRAPRGKRN